MNSKIKPFDNVKVRQAISYAVPYKTIIYAGAAGLRPAADQPDPVRHADPHRRVLRLQDTTTTRRSSCSSEAGYPNGFDTTLDVASGVDEGRRRRSGFSSR